MIPPKSDLCGYSGLGQKRPDFLWKAKGERPHRKSISAAPEDKAGPSDMGKLFQDQDLFPVQSELSGGQQAADPRSDNNSIIGHPWERPSYLRTLTLRWVG